MFVVAWMSWRLALVSHESFPFLSVIGVQTVHTLCLRSEHSKPASVTTEWLHDLLYSE